MTSQPYLTWEGHSGPVCHHHAPYTVIDCEPCGFRHVVPLPSDEELTALYQAQFYRTDKPQYFARYEEDEVWWRQEYADRYALLEEAVGTARRRLLDVGSGPGLFLRVGSERGWDARGIEPSPDAVAYSTDRGAHVVEGFFDAPTAAALGRFDVVHLAHVLEHVPDPVGVLNLVRGALMPGGLVAIVVPNDDNPLQRAAVEQLHVPEWWVSPPHHLSYFDFDSLARLLARCGFTEVMRTTSFPMEWFLLMGDNYIGDDNVGRSAHTKRKRWELALTAAGLDEHKRALYRALAQLGWGRDVVMIARALA